MGFARIVSGGPDGRYTIELDYGAAEKSALLGAFTDLRIKIENALATQDALIATADEKEAVQLAKVLAAQADIIAQSSGNLPPGSPRPDTGQFRGELAILTKMRAANEGLRKKRDALKMDRAQTLRKLAELTAVTVLETRDAWCADLTETAPVGSFVATLDLPGESNLILLAPGARPWAASDGFLTARELMSPAQAFLNAAILPGWQKFKPTYRWGTCTAINYDANTMSVALAAQPSSAQSLGINQSSTLTGVPVSYMTCNANAFEIGDRVVVQFVGQSWDSPLVIGFLDNPKFCDGWKLRLAALSQLPGMPSPPAFIAIVFESLLTPEQYESHPLAALPLTLEYRVDRGAWRAPTAELPGATLRNAAQWTDFSFPGIGGPFLTFTLFPPGSEPGDNGTFFFGMPGTPAHFSITSQLDMGPPINSILEVRVLAGAGVVVNIAVRHGFPPFAVDSGIAIPSVFTDVSQLDYVRFVEDGT